MSAKKQYPLRIDAAIYDALERWAADEFRSVNAHIEYLLRESLKGAGRLPVQRRLDQKPELPDDSKQS